MGDEFLRGPHQLIRGADGAVPVPVPVLYVEYYSSKYGAYGVSIRVRYRYSTGGVNNSVQVGFGAMGPPRPTRSSTATE